MSSDSSAIAKKSLGQHFLINRGVLNRIVDFIEIQPDDIILEIGPGTGLLTELILSLSKKVIAIELDQDLVSMLRHKFNSYSNLEVIHADARDWDAGSIGKNYKVVGNLPYYAANPIMRHFLESKNPPSKMVLTVQKEVAESIVAKPGNMRILSVAVQMYGKPKIAGHIRPGSFNPPPKVTSSIISIDLYSEPLLAVVDRESFFGLVRSAFNSRRKQLRNSLSRHIDVTGAIMEGILEMAGISPTLRAQDLSIADWGRLHEVVKSRNTC